jgi:hypothetical protein
MARSTPLRALSRGLVAGALGTVAMDLLWFRRYKRDGGEDDFVGWEFSGDIARWEEAGPPAQIGKRLLEPLLGRDLPDERAGLVNDVMHWSYGLFWGGQYGIAASSLNARSVLRSGVPFGAIVWASDYVVLPLAEVYEPIWRYDAKTLADDLTAHLVYGVVTAATFRVLSAR